MTAVLVLLAHGCPPQAVVAAFGLDARTVTAWLHRAGGHCVALHRHLVEDGQVEVGHVQADEIRVQGRGGVVWQAMAVALPARLWLGGAVSRARDGALVTRLLERVRAGATTRALLLCVDGFAAYVGAARTVFRESVYTGKRGRPRLVLPAGFLLAQVVKSRQGWRLAEVTRCVVVGTEDAVARVIAATRSDARRHADQHGLHRARPRGDPGHLPRASVAARAAGARDRARDSPRRERHVARRLRLQLLLDPRKLARARHREAQMAGADAGHGHRAGRPCMDHGRDAALPHPAPDTGRHPQTAARSET